MTTFVLCHGAWGAGWVWKRVSSRLRTTGHEVFAPSYTGLGERAHLLTRDVNLQTHIQDVLGVIEWERLEEFVLVGHSYGGMVVTGVGDREWEKVTKLVYLDAFLPQPGQCLDDLTGPARAQAMTDLAEARGDGWRVPRPDASVSTDLPEADRQWILELSCDQPRATFTQKLDIDGDHLKIADKVYVLATENPGSPFGQFADWTRSREGWRTFDLPTHHHLMQSMPDEVVEILLA